MKSTHDANVSLLHGVPSMDIEMQRLYIISMAIVILGGPITSMLLNLFVLPSFYWTFGKAGNPGCLQQQKGRHDGILKYSITVVLLQEAGRFGS